MIIAAAAIATILTATSVKAQFLSDFTACAAKKDNTERLTCFDAAAKAASGDKDLFDYSKVNPAITGESTKTSDAIKPSKPNEYKVVDAADLFVSPGKFEGKAIEVRNVRCFHADKQDYRCLSLTSHVMVNSLDISPASAKQDLEDQCGEIAKVSISKKCLKTIRFTPLTHEEDTLSGFQKRVVVATPVIEIISSKAK